MVFFFFFNDTATTEIYTLSLHDALPIFTNKNAYTIPTNLTISNGTSIAFHMADAPWSAPHDYVVRVINAETNEVADRKSTRLNSSHANISYAVFCLKKKNITVYSYFVAP